MNNFVTFQIALLAANAALIDQVSQLILGSSTVTEEPAPTKAPAAKTTKAEPAAKAPAKAATAATEETSYDQFKDCIKKVKAEHGQEFIDTTLSAAGVTIGASLAKTVSAVDPEQYADLIEILSAGPTDQAADEPEDDGFDDDDGLEDEAEVTVEAVKAAAKAYAKDVGRDEAKEIMTKHGAPTLTAIDKCTPKQLAEMFAAFQ